MIDYYMLVNALDKNKEIMEIENFDSSTIDTDDKL